MRPHEESELLQLPSVTRKREQRMHDLGYSIVRDVAEVNIDELAKDRMIPKVLTRQMIQTAKYLVLQE